MAPIRVLKWLRHRTWNVESKVHVEIFAATVTGLHQAFKEYERARKKVAEAHAENNVDKLITALRLQQWHFDKM